MGYLTPVMVNTSQVSYLNIPMKVPINIHSPKPLLDTRPRWLLTSEHDIFIQGEVSGHLTDEQGKVSDHLSEVLGHITDKQGEVLGYFTDEQGEVLGHLTDKQGEVSGHLTDQR